MVTGEEALIDRTVPLFQFRDHIGDGDERIDHAAIEPLQHTLNHPWLVCMFDSSPVERSCRFLFHRTGTTKANEPITQQGIGAGAGHSAHHLAVGVG